MSRPVTPVRQRGTEGRAVIARHRHRERTGTSGHHRRDRLPVPCPRRVVIGRDRRQDVYLVAEHKWDTMTRTEVLIARGYDAETIAGKGKHVEDPGPDRRLRGAVSGA